MSQWTNHFKRSLNVLACLCLISCPLLAQEFPTEQQFTPVVLSMGAVGIQRGAALLTLKPDAEFDYEIGDGE